MSEKLSAAGFSDFSMFTYGYPFLTAYFKLVLSRVPPERTQKRKSNTDRLISLILFALFRVDTMFTDPECKRGFCLVGIAESITKRGFFA